ncbi:glycosyltransferase [Sediminibacterium sp.]|uniref:glycosyltransferase n=1 Tax=Sediminibacterium sp. TaxID=1917865 RepID=UPI003F6EA3F1
MKIIFLTGLFPENIREDIHKKSKGVVQYAADSLQWAIVEGLDSQTDNLQILNLPYIGSYPLRYKDLKIKSFKFSHKSGSNDLNVGFINLPIYKLISRYYNLKKVLNSVIQDGSETILIYAIHTPFIKATVELKKLYPNIKICLIVPDLPEYMNESEGFLLRTLKHLEKILLNDLIKNVDSFVLLSDFMHIPLRVNNRLWVRVEGIYNPNSNVLKSKKEILKTILYTGTLALRYGILNLVEAFLMIKERDFQLWICGDGDARKKLEEIALNDSRIKIFGQMPREQVLNLQARATVLVNPRIPNDEFTKYSFPSKTIEYLASGTPCILYRLPGIPNEYFKFCYVPESLTIYSLYQKIISVCNKNQNELQEFGERAKQFILQNKSPEKQCEKIYKMLKQSYAN